MDAITFQRHPLHLVHLVILVTRYNNNEQQLLTFSNRDLIQEHSIFFVFIWNTILIHLETEVFVSLRIGINNLLFNTLFLDQLCLNASIILKIRKIMDKKNLKEYYNNNKMYIYLHTYTILQDIFYQSGVLSLICKIIILYECQSIYV